MDGSRAPLEWVWAVRHGEVATVVAMLDDWLEVDALDTSRITPLMQAVMWGRMDMVRMLLSRGAAPNLRGLYGYSATTLATAASRNGHGEALEILLAAGGRRDRLVDAVWMGDVDLARERLDAGEDVCQGEGSYHGTMIQIAALNGDVALVDLFLARGADVEATCDIGWRPLIAAVRMGHAEIVRRLLDHGADPHAKDWEGQTPLDLAKRANRDDIVAMLMQAGAER